MPHRPLHKKITILSLSACALLIVFLFVYDTGPNVEAQSVTDEQAECLQTTSLELHRQYEQKETALASVYLSSSDVDQSFSPEVLAAHDIQVFTSPEQLVEHVAQNSDLAAIYLDPDMLDALPNSWLQQQYRSGVAIVALNTYVSKLAQKLDTKARLADLSPEFTAKYPFFAAFVLNSMNKRTRNMAYADFVASIDHIPEAVNQKIDPYHMSSEYVNALKQECLI